MKLILPKPGSRRRNAWALLVTLTLTACAAMVMTGVLSWSNSSSAIIARNNEYYSTTYAAESATEKVLAGIVSDYENYGEPLVYSKLSTYSNTLPASSDSSYWANYSFSAGAGQSNLMVVNRINPTNIVVLGPPYQGLYMLASTYEIISTATKVSSEYHISAAVGQQVNLGTIPIFQFAIFYQNTMEIDPGANMSVRGFVHGNSDIFVDPNTGATLTFSNDVSSSGTVTLGENPLDPSSRGTPGATAFDGYHLSGINPLILPVGTNTSGAATNMSQNVDAILQVPPVGESPTSGVGTNRLYNQADIIILISNNSVTVTSGVNVNSQATIISNAAWSLFLNTNSSGQFYDQRDSLTVQDTDLDIGKLKAWSATNTTLRTALGGRDLSSVFIADERSTSNTVISTNVSYATNTVATNTVSRPLAGTYQPPITTNTTLTLSTTHPGAGTYLGSISTNKSVNPYQYLYSLIIGYSYQAVLLPIVTNYTYITNEIVVSQSGIVLTNGSTLPSLGLSVVTPDPAYILGNFNVSTDGVTMYTGTSDTSHTRPSAIYADAITILSSAWNVANSASGIGSRVANSDTVNAAFLTGNVPSNGAFYSGGVENFPRFLEDWGGKTFTYNGSMVAMFSSVVATAPWPGTGTVYNPPTRNWAFDLNFNNATKLPPLTPRVISVNRAQWTFLDANTTQF